MLATKHLRVFRYVAVDRDHWFQLDDDCATRDRCSGPFVPLILSPTTMIIGEIEDNEAVYYGPILKSLKSGFRNNKREGWYWCSVPVGRVRGLSNATRIMKVGDSVSLVGKGYKKVATQLRTIALREIPLIDALANDVACYLFPKRFS